MDKKILSQMELIKSEKWALVKLQVKKKRLCILAQIELVKLLEKIT